LISAADLPFTPVRNRRGSDVAAVLFFPYVIETLRTESFLANIPPAGCFSLTCMVAAMNSGIGVRESIGSYALAIDARRRSAEGRSMDRDLGMPKKSQRKHIDTCRGAACAIAVHEAAGLPMKQTWRPVRRLRLDTRLRPKHTTTTARSTRSLTGEH
jgi:hypothetical protein